MWIKKFIAVLVMVSTVFIYGCATIIGGGETQSVHFDSNPKGAKIFLGKIKEGAIVELLDTGLVTPTHITISRKNAVVVLKKEGYEDANVALQKTQNGWFWGNFIIGGLIGSGIDSSTGAINKYEPGAYVAELKKL